MMGPKNELADYQQRASTDYLRLAEEREEEARMYGKDEIPGSKFGMISSLCEFAAFVCRHAADQCSNARNEDEVDAIRFATSLFNDKLDAALRMAPANTSDWPQ